MLEIEDEELKVVEYSGDGGGERGGGTTYYYMWILNDRDGMVDDAPSTLDLTRTSLHDTTELSLGHVGRPAACVFTVVIVIVVFTHSLRTSIVIIVFGNVIVTVYQNFHFLTFMN